MGPEESARLIEETNKTIKNLLNSEGVATPCHAIAAQYIFSESAEALNRMWAQGGHQASYADSNGVTIVFGAGLNPKERADPKIKDMLATDIITTVKNNTPHGTLQKGVIILTNTHLDDAQAMRIAGETGKNVLFGKGHIEDPMVQMHAQVDDYGNFSLGSPDGIHLASQDGVTKYMDKLRIDGAGNQINLTANSIAQEKQQILREYIEKAKESVSELGAMYAQFNNSQSANIGAFMDFVLYDTYRSIDRARTSYESARKRAEDTSLSGEETRKAKVEENIGLYYLEQAKASLENLQTAPYQEIQKRIADLQRKITSESSADSKTLERDFSAQSREEKKKRVFKSLQNLIAITSLQKQHMDLFLLKGEQEAAKEYASLVARNSWNIKMGLILLERNSRDEDLCSVIVKNRTISLQENIAMRDKLRSIGSPAFDIEEIFRKAIALSQLNLNRIAGMDGLILANAVEGNAIRRLGAVNSGSLIVAPSTAHPKELQNKEDLLAELKEALVQSRISLGEKQKTFEALQTWASYQDVMQATKELDALKNKIKIINNVPSFVKDIEAYWAAVALAVARRNFDLMPNSYESEQELQEAEDRLNRLEGFIPNEGQEHQQESGHEETKQNEASAGPAQNQEWRQENLPNQPTASQLNFLGGRRSPQLLRATTAAATGSNQKNRRNRKKGKRR